MLPSFVENSDRTIVFHNGMEITIKAALGGKALTFTDATRAKKAMQTLSIAFRRWTVLDPTDWMLIGCSPSFRYPTSCLPFELRQVDTAHACVIYPADLAFC